jgi:hypothetical protein
MVITIGILLIVLVLILLLKIVLHLDTVREEYFVQVGQVAKFSMVGSGISLKPQLRILWWNVQLKERKSKKKTPKAQKKREKKKRAKRALSSFINNKRVKLGLKVVKSLQIKKLNLELDTGDNLLNAYLYPICWLIKSENRKLNINWNGQNHLILRLEGRVARMIYYMIKK